MLAALLTAFGIGTHATDLADVAQGLRELGLQKIISSEHHEAPENVYVGMKLLQGSFRCAAAEGAWPAVTWWIETSPTFSPGSPSQIFDALDRRIKPTLARSWALTAFQAFAPRVRGIRSGPQDWGRCMRTIEGLVMFPMLVWNTDLQIRNLHFYSPHLEKTLSHFVLQDGFAIAQMGAVHAEHSRIRYNNAADSHYYPSSFGPIVPPPDMSRMSSQQIDDMFWAYDRLQMLGTATALVRLNVSHPDSSRHLDYWRCRHQVRYPMDLLHVPLGNGVGADVVLPRRMRNDLEAKLAASREPGDGVRFLPLRRRDCNFNTFD